MPPMQVRRLGNQSFRGRGSFQPNSKYPQGLPRLTISLSGNGRFNSKNEVFEITEKEASGKKEVAEGCTLVKVDPTELQQLQELPCREVEATGPRLACAHLQRPWIHPRTSLSSSDRLVSLYCQQGRRATLQAEHCLGTRGSQSSTERAVAKYLRGMKGNEPTMGKIGFLGVLAMTTGRQKAKN